MFASRRIALLLAITLVGICLRSGFAQEAKKPPATHKPSQKWALLIGVNDYSYIVKLKYCGADMEALSTQLGKSGFAEQQIRLMSDASKDHKYLPIKSNIETQIELMTSLVEEGDVLLLAFSGHGVSLEGKSYICPEDAKLDDFKTSMVSVDWVYERLQKCKASLKIVVIDACRDDPTPGGKKGVKAVAEDNRKFARPLDKVPEGIVLLNSCSPGETSMEDSEFKKGVFTHYLIEGLTGGADENRDGIVSLTELATYAGKHTKNHVAEKWASLQRPYLKGDLSIDALQFDFGKVEIQTSKELLTNSLGMQLQRIPTGEFEMGNEEPLDKLLKTFPGSVASDFADASPRHTVRITKPFYLGNFTVTRGQFARFVQDSGYRTEAESNGQGGIGTDAEGNFAQKPEYNWRRPGFEQADDHPVVNVSWNDAMKFIEWLSAKEHQKYRLPTEAEWEYCCRAGSKTYFAWGENLDELPKYVNLSDATTKAAFPNWNFTSAASDGYAHTAPVGKFLPNKFGLHHMQGNVGQWCSDWYRADYYANSHGDDPTGPSAETHHLNRGGNWSNRAFQCRAASRTGGLPSYCNNALGFRVAMSAEK